MNTIEHLNELQSLLAAVPATIEAKYGSQFDCAAELFPSAFPDATSFVRGVEDLCFRIYPGWNPDMCEEHREAIRSEYAIPLLSAMGPTIYAPYKKHFLLSLDGGARGFLRHARSYYLHRMENAAVLVHIHRFNTYYNTLSIDEQFAVQCEYGTRISYMLAPGHTLVPTAYFAEELERRWRLFAGFADEIAAAFGES